MRADTPRSPSPPARRPRKAGAALLLVLAGVSSVGVGAVLRGLLGAPGPAPAVTRSPGTERPATAPASPPVRPAPMADGPNPTATAERRAPELAPDEIEGYLGQVLDRARRSGGLTAAEVRATSAAILELTGELPPAEVERVLTDFLDRLQAQRIEQGALAPSPPRPDRRQVEDAVAAARSPDQLRAALDAIAAVEADLDPRWGAQQRERLFQPPR